MRYELQVLRAVVRLARLGQAAGLGDLQIRAGGSPPDIRSALRRLEGQGWVTRGGADVARPTLAGLALCVALSDVRRRASSRRPPARRSEGQRAA